MPEDNYVATLLNDIDQQLPRVWGRRIVSIFFGGGTPSLFSPQSIEKILLGIYQRFRYGPETEITLEANPGTVDESRFVGFKQAGVNRLSIGVQSLQDEKLRALGRIHNRDYALRAIDAAIKAGFDNFNLDLMHGLPNQSIDDARQDLRDALGFHPPHLSWYQLTIEPNTLFYKKPPVLPKDETLWAIQEQGKNDLARAGLQQYEISAYARAQRECLHNRNYWEFGDYLGIGAGAYSKITDLEKQVVTRHLLAKNPKDYLSLSRTAPQEQIISEADVVFEFMLNALRLIRGVPLSLFVERTGLSVAALEPTLSIAREKKLLVTQEDLLCATELGQRFLNDVIGMFLP